MSKKPIHAKPSLYAFYFESLKVIADKYGYNLLLHGSMNRDLDLVAVAWIDNPKDEFKMIQEFSMHLTGVKSDDKTDYLFSVLPGGRNGYVININRSIKYKFNNMVTELIDHEDPQYYLDVSVVPIPKP